MLVKKLRKYSKNYLIPLVLGVGLNSCAHLTEDSSIYFPSGKTLSIEQKYDVDLIGNFTNNQINIISNVLENIYFKFPKVKSGLELVIGNSQIKTKNNLGLAVVNSNSSISNFSNILNLSSQKAQNLKLQINKDSLKKTDYVILYVDNLNKTQNSYSDTLTHELGHLLTLKKNHDKLDNTFFRLFYKINSVCKKKSNSVLDYNNCNLRFYVSKYAYTGALYNVDYFKLQKSIIEIYGDKYLNPKIQAEINGLDNLLNSLEITPLGENSQKLEVAKNNLFYMKNAMGKVILARKNEISVIVSEELAETFLFDMSGKKPKNDIIEYKLKVLNSYLDSNWK